MRAEGRGARALAVATLAFASVAACRTREGDVLSLAPGAAGSAGADAAAGADGAILDAQPLPVGVYYISPAGLDTNPGTRALPWQTFPHALPLLQPGSTLVLLDGTYTNATNGLLQVFCGANAVDGTAAQPITVRADNERQAFIKGDGSGGAPIELSACSNWVLDGLHAEEADFPHETGDEEAGSVVVLTHCANVLARRILAAHPNRYYQASVYIIAHALPGVVVEESEALDFHYYGFHAEDSQQTVFRRDYAHSRDTPDIVGGTTTAFPTQGDTGFRLSKSLSCIVENCVAEDVADGFTIEASPNAQGGRVQPMADQLLGDVANGVSHAGYVLNSQCDGVPKPCDQGDQIVSHAMVANDVARGGALGVDFSGGVQDTFDDLSIFDVTDTGVSLGLTAQNMGLASITDAVRGTQVSAAGAMFGFHAVGQMNWTFARDNAFGPTTTFAPRDNHLANATELDPQLGGCLVYVPASSPLKAPAGGPGVGANIVYEYRDGQLTSTKLWDQTTGAFPCGATVAGLDDEALTDTSCLGVAARLHVGTMGCAIP